MRFFSWLRRNVRDAFVGGVADGITLIEDAAQRAETEGEPLRLPGEGLALLEAEPKPNGRPRKRVKT